MFSKWLRKKSKNTTSHFNSEKLFLHSNQDMQALYAQYDTSSSGLTPHEAESGQRFYGKNEIARQRKDKWFMLFIKTFINPFIGILMFLAVLSLVIDVLMVERGERQWSTVIIITCMVSISALLRFYQEMKSGRATEALKKMVNNTASVYRYGEKKQLKSIFPNWFRVILFPFQQAI